MAVVKGEPQTNAALASADVRTNLDSLFEGDFEPIRVRAQTTPNMTVQVEDDNSRAYVQGNTALDFAGGNSPTFTAPLNANEKQIDIITLDSSGTLAITSGTPTTGTPTPPTYPGDKIVLAEIYLRNGMASIKNTDDSTNGYIFKVRSPLFNMGSPPSQLVPTGGIMPYGGSSAPTGFLLCDGTAVSRTTYADLFAIIGTTFGDGDGSTTFNVPNSLNQTLSLIAQGDGTAIGDLTNNGGLAASFDGDRTQTGANSSNSVGNVTVGYIGKDWGSGITHAVKKAIAYATSDFGFFELVANEELTITLQGSTDNFSASTVNLGVTIFALDKKDLVIQILTNNDTAYRYHRLKIEKAGGNECYCTEAEFYKGAQTIIKT